MSRSELQRASPADARLFDTLVAGGPGPVEPMVAYCLRVRDARGTVAAATDLVSHVLLPAFEEVVRLYEAHNFILPQVLDSAAAVRRARLYLKALVGEIPGINRGTVIVATLAGDVHDMGRVLLVSLMEASGYRVIDLGRQVPVEQIVEAAQSVPADVVALSALLATTSREMPRCVKALDERGPHLPVLVGGAAIDRSFGRRIAVLPDGRFYEPGVFYCRDVFEGLRSLARLLGDVCQREEFVQAFRAEVARESAAAANSQTNARTTPLPGRPPEPQPRLPHSGGMGVQVLSVPLPDVWQHLDKGTLFRFHWGGYRLSHTAQSGLFESWFEPILERLKVDAIERGWLGAEVVSGHFACGSDGDDLVMFGSAKREEVLARFTFPRQPAGDRLCLADYFRPVQTGERDVVVLQAVTTGRGVAGRMEELREAGEYSEMLRVGGLAAATAESLAEWAHALARHELGIGREQGLRFSWGYPACPDLGQQEKVLELLSARELIGLHLTPSSNLEPEYSTVALVVHHPQAKYFSMGHAEHSY